MKLVVTGKELRNKMHDAINLLCGTVKTTLGPKGSNVIIDHSSFSPFITNDGVTIAENIVSEDEVINTILEIAKEASIKTNELVGDGTTTTLVILQSIIENGLVCLDNGINPLVLKKELDELLPGIVEKLKKESWIPKKDDLKKIATISSGSEEIGKIISNAFNIVKNKDMIKIMEGSYETEIIHKNGYIIESIISPYYFIKNKNINLIDSYILIINTFINDIEEIAEVLNYVIEEKKNLIILAKDFSNKFNNDILSLYLENKLNIFLLKIPGYGQENLQIIQDLSEIASAKIINDLNGNIDSLGIINNITLNMEEMIIGYKKDNIKKDLVSKSLIEIKVGALTTTERREKKMRFDDALWAIASAKRGVLLGSGIPLYKISEELEDNNNGSRILKKALKKPFEQIMENAGINSIDIIKNIKNKKYLEIFNVNTNSYDALNNTLVIDSLEVVIKSLQNAISIAGMLLTTTSIVINELDNKFINNNIDEI